jgi:hypothetical protein
MSLSLSPLDRLSHVAAREHHQEQQQEHQEQHQEQQQQKHQLYHLLLHQRTTNTAKAALGSNQIDNSNTNCTNSCCSSCNIKTCSCRNINADHSRSPLSDRDHVDVPSPLYCTDTTTTITATAHDSCSSRQVSNDWRLYNHGACSDCPECCSSSSSTTITTFPAQSIFYSDETETCIVSSPADGLSTPLSQTPVSKPKSRAQSFKALGRPRVRVYHDSVKEKQRRAKDVSQQEWNQHGHVGNTNNETLRDIPKVGYNPYPQSFSAIKRMVPRKDHSIYKEQTQYQESISQSEHGQESSDHQPSLNPSTSSSNHVNPVSPAESTIHKSIHTSTRDKLLIHIQQHTLPTADHSQPSTSASYIPSPKSTPTSRPVKTHTLLNQPTINMATRDKLLGYLHKTKEPVDPIQNSVSPSQHLPPPPLLFTPPSPTPPPHRPPRPYVQRGFSRPAKLTRKSYSRRGKIQLLEERLERLERVNGALMKELMMNKNQEARLER